MRKLTISLALITAALATTFVELAIANTTASRTPRVEAKTKSDSTPPAVAAMVKRMAEAGGGMKTAVERLPGSSIWGIGLSRDGLTQVFYTDDKGSVLLVGMAVLLPDKVSASKRFVEKHFPGTKDLAQLALGDQMAGAVKEDAPRLDTAATLKTLEEVAYVEVGKPTASRRIYAFVDAGCEHCQALHKAVEADLNAPTSLLKDVAWRWVPIEIDSAEPTAWHRAALAFSDGASPRNAITKFFQAAPSIRGDATKAASLLLRNAAASNVLQLQATPTFFVVSSDANGEKSVVRAAGFSTLQALLSR